MADAKRRKTSNPVGSTNLANNVNSNAIDELCARLVRCQEENGNDTTMDEIDTNKRIRIPDDIRASVKQAASLLQVCDHFIIRIHIQNSAMLRTFGGILEEPHGLSYNPIY